MIRSSELMIGDWVRLVADNEEEVLQVNYIRRDGVGFKKYAVYFDEIEPIPLTVEILEKNGFYRNKYFDHNGCGFFSFPVWMIMKRSGFGIEKRNNIYYITGHALMPMRYVHELQRALRSCDLWYFANNFKI